MIGYVTMGCRLDLRCPSMCSSSLVTSTCGRGAASRVLCMANSYSYLFVCHSLLACLDLGTGSHRGMAHEKFSWKFSGTVVTVHCWHQLALEQHLPSPGPAFQTNGCGEHVGAPFHQRKIVVEISVLPVAWSNDMKQLVTTLACWLVPSCFGHWLAFSHRLDSLRRRWG